MIAWTTHRRSRPLFIHSYYLLVRFLKQRIAKVPAFLLTQLPRRCHSFIIINRISVPFIRVVTRTYHLFIERKKRYIFVTSIGQFVLAFEEKRRPFAYRKRKAKFSGRRETFPVRKFRAIADKTNYRTKFHFWMMKLKHRSRTLIF